MSDLPDNKYVSHVAYLSKHKPFSRYICLQEADYLKQLLFSIIKKSLEQSDKTPPESYLFHAKDFNLDDWLDKTESSSFFSTRKFVLLKNFAAVDKKKLKKILSAPLFTQEDQQTVIVLEDTINSKEAQSLLGKNLDESWQIVDDASLTKKQWMGRLQKRFEWYQLSPPSTFIESLMKQSLMDLDTAIQQADRWGLQYAGKTDIEWDKVKFNQAQLDQSVIFDLSDALLNKNHAKSLQIYFSLLEQGKTLEEILYFLLNHCLLLAQVKTTLDICKNPHEAESVFKDLNPYRLKKLIQQALNASSERIMEAIERLLNVDKQYKTQSDLSLETLLVSVIGSV
jgi:DNA polymerase III subunit delta